MDVVLRWFNLIVNSEFKGKHSEILKKHFLLCFSNLRSVFLGERNGLSVASVPVTRIGLLKRTIECKESRIGKQPIEVPKNVTITLEGQDMKVKGPLGELALSYPREVIVEREESGILRVRKAVETRRANQMHGLFRCTLHPLLPHILKSY